MERNFIYNNRESGLVQVRILLSRFRFTSFLEEVLKEAFLRALVDRQREYDFVVLPEKKLRSVANSRRTEARILSCSSR